MTRRTGYYREWCIRVFRKMKATEPPTFPSSHAWWTFVVAGSFAIMFAIDANLPTTAASWTEIRRFWKVPRALRLAPPRSSASTISCRSHACTRIPKCIQKSDIAILRFLNKPQTVEMSVSVRGLPADISALKLLTNYSCTSYPLRAARNNGVRSNLSGKSICILGALRRARNLKWNVRIYIDSWRAGIQKNGRWPECLETDRSV